MTVERENRFLLRLIKRMRAFSERVRYAEGLGIVNADFFEIDWLDVVLDHLGIPSTVIYGESDPRTYCRDFIHDRFRDAHSDAQILEAFAFCRSEAELARQQGFSAPEQWSAFDDFEWGTPAPSDRNCEVALKEGVELFHGMTEADVQLAITEARIRRRKG